MQPTNCLNCGKALQAGQNYCPNCGQKTDTPRITMRRLLFKFLQIVTHTEKGLLKLMMGLAINPGRTAKEYVEGKRKTYFDPFTFLAVCVAFMLLLNNWIKPYDDLPTADPQVMARISDDTTKHLYLLTIERTARVQNILNENMNIFSVLITPYFAFFLWVFFKNRKRNIAEITVAYLLFSGFSNVVITILFSPLLAMYHHTSAYYPVLCSSFLLETFYFAWGLKIFFNYKSVSGYIKVFAALSLIGMLGFIIFFIGMVLYVYHGGALKVLNYL